MRTLTSDDYYGCMRIRSIMGTDLPVRTKNWDFTILPDVSS